MGCVGHILTVRFIEGGEIEGALVTWFDGSLGGFATTRTLLLLRFLLGLDYRLLLYMDCEKEIELISCAPHPS
jgi:hypothetical protein